MTDFFGYMEASEVANAKTLANYIQQQLGTPFPSAANLGRLNKQAKQFFQQYDEADWSTLVRVVEFCRARKKRPPHCYSVMAQIRYAYAAGYLPELNPKERVDDGLESAINEALKVERDERWRERLIASTGIDARRKVYTAWQSEHAASNG